MMDQELQQYNQQYSNIKHQDVGADGSIVAGGGVTNVVGDTTGYATGVSMDTVARGIEMLTNSNGPLSLPKLTRESISQWYSDALTERGVPLGDDARPPHITTNDPRDIIKTLCLAASAGDLSQAMAGSYATLRYYFDMSLFANEVKAPPVDVLQRCITTMGLHTPLEFLTFLVMGYRGLILSRVMPTRFIVYDDAVADKLSGDGIIYSIMRQMHTDMWFMVTPGSPSPYNPGLIPPDQSLQYQRNVLEAIIRAPERPLPVKLRSLVIGAYLLAVPEELQRIDSAASGMDRAMQAKVKTILATVELMRKATNDVKIAVLDPENAAYRYYGSVAKEIPEKVSGVAPGGAIPLTPACGMIYYFLSTILTIGADFFMAMQPAAQYLVKAYSGLEAPDAMPVCQYFEDIFVKMGFNARGMLTTLRGIATRISTKQETLQPRASAAKKWTLDKVKTKLRGVGSVLDDSSALRPMIQRIEAELVQCRQRAMADGDLYTYRRAKVMALRYVRKTIESMLTVRVPGSAAEGEHAAKRCIKLHNNTRHLFTFKTWRELLPDIEDFIMSGDNEKDMKEYVLHKRFELFALLELASVLEEAIKRGKQMYRTLRDVSTGAQDPDSGQRKVLDLFDELVWLQQKAWQEHGLDAFYTKEKYKEMSQALPWCLENSNLFDKALRLKEYSPELNDMLNLNAFNEDDEAFYAEADADYAAKGNRADYDAKKKAWADEHDCPLRGSSSSSTKPKNKGNNDDDDDKNPECEGSPEDKKTCNSTTNTELMRAFTSFDDAALKRFFDELADKDYLRKGLHGGGTESSTPQYALKSPNLTPLIKAQQQRVGVLAEAAKQVITLAAKQMSMLAQTDVRAVLMQYVQASLERVADIFYYRIRMGTNEYLRSFGAKAAMPGEGLTIDSIDVRATRFDTVRKRNIIAFVVWSMTEIDSIVLYVLKFVRVATLLIAMYAAEKMFTERYLRDVYAQRRPPPQLVNVLLLAMSIDACFQLMATTMIVVASIMIKTKTDRFVLDDDFIALMLKEYLLSTAFILVLGAIVASVMSSKKYFAYRTDGLRVIRGYSEMMMGVFVVVAIAPFFRLSLSDTLF
jgi:hypothetical protein